MFDFPVLPCRLAGNDVLLRHFLLPDRQSHVRSSETLLLLMLPYAFLFLLLILPLIYPPQHHSSNLQTALKHTLYHQTGRPI